jgi:hypothetical protein
MDRYLEAATEARDLARTHVERLEPMKTQVAPKLNQAAQKAMYDKHYRPLLEKGDVAGALKLVAQQAPLGSDYEKELRRLVDTFGGE